MNDYHRWKMDMEETKRKHYQRLLLGQNRIQDLIGVLVFVQKNTNGHIRFIKSSLVLDTHIRRLLREAKLNDCRLTLEETQKFLKYCRIDIPLDDQIVKRWASEEVYRKMKGEDEALPFHTQFNSLPRIQL